MKVSQTYFNPRRKNVFLNSFCYTPSNKEEGRLGHIYILGQTNNRKLLKDIAIAIKEEYYSKTNRDKEVCFNKALEKANKILEKEQADINIGVIGIHEYSLLYSQIGQLKVLLLRDNEIMDIAKEANRERTFSDIINGELEKKDIIIMQNNELFEQFWEKNIFNRIKQIKRLGELRKIFKEKKEVIRHFYGTSLFIYIKKPLIKIYFDYSKLAIPFMKLSKKIFPTSIDLQEKMTKGLICIVIFIIILLLGWLVF